MIFLTVLVNFYFVLRNILKIFHLYFTWIYNYSEILKNKFNLNFMSKNTIKNNDNENNN